MKGDIPRACCKYIAENTATRQYATFESDPPTTAASSARLRNSRRSISGERTRDSMKTKAISSAAPPISVPTVAGEVQPQSSPRSKPRLMQTMLPVIATMPARSMCLLACSSRVSAT